MARSCITTIAVLCATSWALLETAAQTAAAEPGVLEFLRSRGSRRFDNVPRQVLAFYYTWYGRPERHGRWVHWGRVDAARHDISAATHYPARGAYDSHDPDIMDWHMDLAKQAGLTGFIATWWGRDTFDDRAFAQLVKRANHKNFQVTVYWENAPGEGQTQIDRAVEDLVYVLRRYGAESSFLKVGGKPVIFVYGRVMGQVPLASWPAIINKVQRAYGDCVLIADGYSDAYARLFDGVHTYNPCGWVAGKTAEQLGALSEETFANNVSLARRRGKISCLTVIPGYNDTKIRKPGLNADRLHGETYRTLWRKAVQADPDWVLITSWNEWHEGSEIEPSHEDGDRYVKLTADCAPRFRDSRPHAAAPRTPPSASAADLSARLRGLYEGVTIGVLPGYGGEVVFWLSDAGVSLRELDWRDLLDPQSFNAKRLPVVVCAGDEYYVRTVEQDGDVVQSLQRYLREGGTLVALPHMPFPFFYDETGKPRNAAADVGLPIAGGNTPRPGRDLAPLARGWEKPPVGGPLRFHTDTQQLLGLPAVADFPRTGDLRWRPAAAALVDPGDHYTSLVRLVGPQDQYYGDGVACVRYAASPLRGGTTIYAWMRMPEVLGGEKLFFAIFRLAREHVAR